MRLGSGIRKILIRIPGPKRHRIPNPQQLRVTKKNDVCKKEMNDKMQQRHRWRAKKNCKNEDKCNLQGDLHP
jgi:hypothetical protein